MRIERQIAIYIVKRIGKQVFFYYSGFSAVFLTPTTAFYAFLKPLISYYQPKFYSIQNLIRCVYNHNCNFCLNHHIKVGPTLHFTRFCMQHNGIIHMNRYIKRIRNTHISAVVIPGISFPLLKSACI